jgi:hypothetical protein
MRYSETWMFPSAAAFGEQYLGTVHRLTGTVNIAKFRAFDPGEALFVGARCQWQGDQPFCSITFDFECRPNVTHFYVKGTAQFPKEGWEYVWVRYEGDVNGGALVRRPLFVYKNKIYNKAAWSPLLITTESVGRPVNRRVPGTPTPRQAANFFLGRP